MSDGKFWLGQLRHAYKQAVDGVIGDQKDYARYLLGPAVAEAEKAWEERDRYRAALEKIERISERWAFQSDDRGLVHGTARDALKGTE